VACLSKYWRRSNREANTAPREQTGDIVLMLHCDLASIPMPE